MTKKATPSGLFEIHIAVLLFGLAGLFGKFLSMPAWMIVFGRTGFAMLALGSVLLASRNRHWPKDPRSIAVFGLLGVILAIHWITFFHAIQVSSVAVGLLSFSTFPVFTALIEPWWFDERRRVIDMVTALLVFSGLAIMVYPVPAGGQVLKGALWGTVAGFTFAILSLLNRKWVRDYPPVTIAFMQNGFAALFLLPLALARGGSVSAGQMGLLVLLGVVCTALSHALFIRGLTFLRAQLASIIACLEPLYGIVFAYLLLDERPSLQTLAGGAVILVTTFLAMVHRVRV
ncbi:DMT family transporter [Desulfosarcina cetonica]